MILPRPPPAQPPACMPCSRNDSKLFLMKTALASDHLLLVLTILRVRGRSLFDVLRKAAGRVDARLARSVAISVACGMAYLHSRQPPILHKVRAPVHKLRLGRLRRVLCKRWRMAPVLHKVRVPARSHCVGNSRALSCHANAGIWEVRAGHMWQCRSAGLLRSVRCLVSRVL